MSAPPPPAVAPVSNGRSLYATHNLPPLTPLPMTVQHSLSFLTMECQNEPPQYYLQARDIFHSTLSLIIHILCKKGEGVLPMWISGVGSSVY